MLSRCWLDNQPHEIGRELYFYGSNPVASLFSGHRVNRTLVLAYAAAGIFVGLAAMVMVARVNSARVGFGETYLLQALLVVVLAGFDPFGGRGRFGNLLLAVIMLQVLQTGFTILNFSPFVKNLAWGSALVIVMVLSRALNCEQTGQAHSESRGGYCFHFGQDQGV